MDALLLSNSTNNGQAFLSHAKDAITASANGSPVVFVPFALANWDAYTALVREALPHLEMRAAHETGDPRAALLAARCVMIGGGNTFRLLAALQKLDVVEALAHRVTEGECSYIGSSAGTNIAGPSIRTTNDMPIVEVHSLRSLGVVPFQINPHYTDVATPGLQAETRAERLAQFHEHHSTPVVALYEGAWIRVRGVDRRIGGATGAKVFEPQSVVELAPGASLDPWWHPAVFDGVSQR